MFARNACIAIMALFGGLALAAKGDAKHDVELDADVDIRAEFYGAAREPQDLEASTKIIPGATTHCTATHALTTRGVEGCGTEYQTHTTSVCVTTTSTCTQTSTSTPTTSTTTITATTTSTVTDPTSTNTATFTTVSTQTDTTSEIETITVTTSTTTTISTVTISTSSGFRPVQTSLAGSTYSGSAGPISPQLVSRDDGSSADNTTYSLAYELDDDAFVSIPRDLENFEDETYRRGLTCHVTNTEKYTTTAYTTTTAIVTLATPVVTTTTTLTVMTTTTPICEASITTTLIVTTTSTATSTQTETETDTVTTTIDTPTTVYAACLNSNNYADKDFGNTISGVEIETGDQGTISSGYVQDAYDCCNSAFVLYEGTDSVYVFAFNPSTSLCTTFHGSSCASGQSSNVFTAQLNRGSIVTLGNGNCGQVVFAI